VEPTGDRRSQPRERMPQCGARETLCGRQPSLCRSS
jgi:hypothetical protein